MDRRSFLMTAPVVVLAAAPAALLTVAGAEAAAPFAGTPGPAFYRMPLGDFEITALLDGTVPIPLNTMYNNTTPAQVDTALAAAFLRAPVELSVNAYLVNTGDRLILIDAGTGTLLGARLGHLFAALDASGYQPAQIDAVVLTHIHTDHSGGLVVDGARMFPNATLHANKRDVDFWLDRANLDSAPEDKKALFREAVGAIGPYQEANRFQTFAEDADPLPGFKSIWRPGHTPGHSSIVVESRGEQLVVWGDITHGDVLQFDEPGVGIAFDVDSPAAAVARLAAFTDAAERRYWVAGAHIRFPGIGHVSADNNGFDWVPANYSADG